MHFHRLSGTACCRDQVGTVCSQCLLAGLAHNQPLPLRLRASSDRVSSVLVRRKAGTEYRKLGLGTCLSLQGERASCVPNAASALRFQPTHHSREAKLLAVEKTQG